MPSSHQASSSAAPALSLPGPIVSSSWLAEHLDHPLVVVADVRWYVDGRSGDAAYDAGHLPGAVFINLDEDLAGDPEVGPGRHPLPFPENFASAMQRAGIGDDCLVVAYDDAAGSIAARLWWMLSALGIRAAVLDGGISSWFGELSIDVPVAPEDVTFTPKAWPLDQVVDAVAVDALRRGDSVTLLDARSSERYAGVPNPVDKRFGHIPGALNAPWGENIDPETGKFRSVGELRERFTRVGVRADRPAVCHCGSGVTACHNLLAMAVAKLPTGRLYPGSWSDWSADEGRAIETSHPS